ncbi:hypothetical protein [Evansella cellulosilytica]|uniref:Uncharacterized protein n=1 Tax=Evansella cellulosilytica (strain ATCC 21833 / DSM 2522 / FERM P-1141 / JCM 9156 / N-4) TaxID=649639 RepID=E6TVX8_EVAC2|nr:hypothetical protein [Evansella cellulosilytica]ADU28687.1 hypothetical protein Bcell_0405 [Evansella cellulosilytica DSM 2522]
MRKIFKIIFVIILAVILLWVISGIIDFSLVNGFEKKPIFAIPTVTADDGGSGTYQGLGYSFEIEGDFMSVDEPPRVTYYEYYILGSLISKGNTD